MSHEISINSITGKAEMAYKGAIPWHGLGQEVDPSASIDDWRTAAGMDWDVEVVPVQYQTPDGLVKSASHRVIVRNDTFEQLGVVTDRYKPVEISKVLEFFRRTCDAGRLEMETLGVLYGGKRVWGLARAAEGVKINGCDLVRPYVLMHTSFDGSSRSSCKATDIRVVCRNTIEQAVRDYLDSEIRVHHRSEFNPGDVAERMGLIERGFSKFIEKAQRLADQPVHETAAADWLAGFMQKSGWTTRKGDDVRTESGFKRIMTLFNGDAIGHELAGDSRWGLLNAVTEYVDHEMGRGQDARLKSAWFGKGAELKSAAFESLLKVKLEEVI